MKRAGLLGGALLVLVGCDPTGQGAGGNVAGQGGAAGAAGAGGSNIPAGFTIGGNFAILPNDGSGFLGGGASGQGGAAGASGTGGTAGVGASTGALACVPNGPSGAPPSTAVCGDGFLTGNEQCDDGNLANGDACSSTCVVTPTLIAPHVGSSGVLPFPGRELGSAPHPSAVGCNTVGVAYLDRASTPAALKLASFSSVGLAQGVIDLGGAVVDSPNPSLAALPGDAFVAAWTAFDSHQLGIRLSKTVVGSAVQAPTLFANVEQAFTQRDADVIFDGNEVVVAWVDDSDPVNGPDLRYRTFSADLSPTSDDQTLAATNAVEDDVVLAAFQGRWAAAWRRGSGGNETIEVQSGTTHWSVGPFLPGATDDHPALAFVDAKHLVVAFTEGTDPLASGVANTPRLHGAILDTQYPGQTQSFEVKPTVVPYSGLLELAQTQPAVVSFADRLVVAWRSSSIVGDPVGDEMWSREIKWSAGPSNTLLVDTSAAERPLLVGGDLRSGDQSRVALLSSRAWPDHRLVTVWEEDSHRVLANTSGIPEILVQFAQVPGELPDPAPGPCAGVTLVTSPSGHAISSASVTLTATATCGGAVEAEYQFGYVAPGSSILTYIRTWGPAMAAWNTAGLPSGTYTLYAYARRKGTSVGFDSVAGNFFTVGRVCDANPTFTITPSGVQPLGTALSLSAGATCTQGGVPEFHSMYQAPGSSSWINIGTWSTTPVSWDTAGLASGSYTLLTYIRASGNASVSEAYVYGAKLLGTVCPTVNSISGSPASPQGVGATIALSGSATCTGGATPEFLYYYYAPGSGSPVQIGTWSARPVNWTTTGLPPGNFTLLAYARAAGNGGQESYGYGGFQLGNLCPSVSLSASLTAPQAVGTNIPLTASAGCSPAEYQFWYRLWGTSTWTLFRDWSGTATATWSSTGLASGNYEIRVDARIAGHSASETSTEISYLIGNVCGTTSASVSPSSPQTRGTTITLAGTATCNGGATPEYEYFYRAPGQATPTQIGSGWSGTSVNWTTTSLATGAYSLYVYARAQGNTDAYEATSERSFTLQ